MSKYVYPLMITDHNGYQYSLCTKGTKNGNKVLKTLITLKDGNLMLDPWAVTDHRTNNILENNQKNTDPCFGDAGIINAQTPNTLRIAFPKRTAVGNPTLSETFHYQTWVIGINSIGLKVRPTVTDYQGKKYKANVSASTISLGPSIGYSFGWSVFTERGVNSYSVTPSIAMGFSSASLSKEVLKKEVDASDKPNNLILSPSFSCIIARNEIGLILSYGIDSMQGEHSSAWAYQGKGFFGIGLSAQFKL